MNKKLWEYDEQLEEVLDENRYPVAEEVLEPENGYLLAAAPEMYDILDQLTRIGCGVGGLFRLMRLQNEAEELLKKARGEK